MRRIKYLLENGALSGSILALTFSIKASKEMRERLSAMDTDAAIEMWVGTFDSFGRELVTKWPSRVGRTAKVASSTKPDRSASSKITFRSARFRYLEPMRNPLRLATEVFVT